MSTKKYPTFNVKIDGKDVALTIKEPTLTQQQNSSKAYNAAFKDAILSGALLRPKLDDFVREQGLWNDEKQAELTKLQQNLFDLEKKLAKGGYKKAEAKQDAFSISDLRNKIRQLLSPRSSLDNNTAEGQADNARFNSLVASCVVYKENEKPFFKDYGDYLNRASETSSIEAASYFAKEYYGLDDDYAKKLPENKFLSQFGYVNADLELVNEKGELVDREGKRVNKFGQFVGEDGETIVDKDGNPVDEDGNYNFKDAEPFLEDDGTPIIIEEKKEEEVKEEEKKEEVKPVEENKIEENKTEEVKE